jgi:hypothetical protein
MEGRIGTDNSWQYKNLETPIFHVALNPENNFITTYWSR